MGKALIIHGADFSSVAVASLTGGYWLLGNTKISLSNQALNVSNPHWPSGESVSALIRGLHVTKVKFYCGSAGTLYIYHATTMVESTMTATQLATITCTSSDVDKVVEKDVDFTFPSTGYLAIGVSESGVMDYLYDSSMESSISLNPVYTPINGSLLSGRYYNNDFYIEL